MKQSSLSSALSKGRELESQIELLENLGFKSQQLVDVERGRFNFYFERPKHETVHVTDLWSLREQKKFLKMEGLIGAEKERVKRATLETIGKTSVNDRRQQDKFRDLSRNTKLPKLTQETNKLRNRPTNRRVLETYSLYSKSHQQLEHLTLGSPKHFQSPIKREHSRFFSPQHSITKLNSDFNELIDTCTNKMKTIQDLRHDMLSKASIEVLKSPKHSHQELKRVEKIANKVKKLLDSDFYKI